KVGKRPARRKVEPGIRKRGRRWAIDTYYRFHRLRESFATYEAAEANLRKLKTLIDEGRYIDAKRQSSETLGQLKERYLGWCEGIGQKARASKKSHTERILRHFGQETLVAKLTKADIEAYQASLRSCIAERKSTMLK